MLTSAYDFIVNIVMVINITINKTFSIHDSVKNYSCHNVLMKRNQYFQCFNIHTNAYRQETQDVQVRRNFDK